LFSNTFCVCYIHTVLHYSLRTDSRTESKRAGSPRWPPKFPAATSLCEPHREFIEAQLRLGRNATAIYQDLVDQHGFAGAYNSVKRFCASCATRSPSSSTA
jgi:hypothetical protein